MECEQATEQEVLEKNFKVYGTFENPLFLAKDVAGWIEHSNVSMMLNKVDEDEKQLIEISTLNNAYGRSTNLTSHMVLNRRWFI